MCERCEGTGQEPLPKTRGKKKTADVELVTELYDLQADPLELRNLVGQGLPEEQELSGWLARKYQWMVENPLFEAPEGVQIETEYIEELKALGYLN